MEKLYKHIGGAVIRISAFVLFLEIIISGGILFDRFQSEVVHREKWDQKNAFQIVCLGESMSASGGDFSYPNQLETILNQAGKDKQFRVVNLSQAGINSVRLVDKMEKYVPKHRPDMVVAMMGINDGYYQHGQMKVIHKDTFVESMLLKWQVV
ncbi:MAG: hypothetical protein KC713_04855, partial [Candidatus Omnitrophica bacterium]|nr:hypothetical protein [Candidatus Omnitrophota bacterium]